MPAKHCRFMRFATFTEGQHKGVDVIAHRYKAPQRALNYKSFLSVLY